MKTRRAAYLWFGIITKYLGGYFVIKKEKRISALMELDRTAGNV
jgi:hypothetical protein